MAFNIELHSTPNSNIKFTVALPVYNSKKIAWISLESLIRQENIDFDWELIVYEEIHSESVCPQILEDYKKGVGSTTLSKKYNIGKQKILKLYIPSSPYKTYITCFTYLL